MLFLSTLTFLLVASVSGSYGNGNGRILNGIDSDVLPYQVKLSGCGGTIIQLDWVLTAKHCVVRDFEGGDFTRQPETVWAGISNTNNKEAAQRRDISIESVFLHDSADLALLKLDPPLEQSDRVWPIKLNDAYGNMIGKEVLISGWGDTTNEWGPDQLKKAVMRVKDQKLDTSGFEFGHELNLWSPDGIGACFGDSGGPAVISYNSCPRCEVLVGVASHVRPGCGPSVRPEVNNGARSSYYIDVFHYIDWIDETIHKDTNPEPEPTTPESGSCANGQWDCNNGHCIPESWVEDNECDCEDGSDEREGVCDSGYCNSDGQWKCNNGQCIRELWVEDNICDCKDGSDEPQLQNC